MSIAVARKAASRLFTEAGLELPVDLRELLSWRGLRLEFEDGWPNSLCARLYASERLVVVNGRHARVRQRFSIAHELGHLHLGHEDVDINHGIEAIFGDEDESYDKVQGDLEREANAFAAELLMPKVWITGQKVSSTENLVSLIRSCCDVSEPAAWYRIMEVKAGVFGNTRGRARH